MRQVNPEPVLRDGSQHKLPEVADDHEDDPGEPHAPGPRAYLEEIFYVSSRRSSLYRVRLTESGLTLRKESSCVTKSDSIALADIVGCRCLRAMKSNRANCVCRPGAARRQQRKLVESTEEVQPHDEFDASAYIYIYAYVLKRPKRRERMTITLRFRSFDRFEDNLREASRWRLAIKCLKAGQSVPKSYLSPSHRNLQSLVAACPEEKRKLLVILNPKSGPGRGREVFQKRVHPVLAEAEKPYDVFITKHSNYAMDFLRTRDLNQWSGLALVGGDGIVFEAVNGLLQRPDWEQVLKNFPIGVIPCGSGNGLAKSIAYSRNEPYDQNPILISALSLISGRTSKMDLVRVETRSQTFYSFLSVGWGFLADIDIESEWLRAIGGQRFLVWSIARLISLRTYKGTVSYLPCDPAKVPTSPEANRHRHTDNTVLPNGLKRNGDLAGHIRRTSDHHHQSSKICHSRSYGDKLDNFANEMHESKSFDGAFDLDNDCEDKIGDDMDQTNDNDVISSTLALETESISRNRLGSFYSATSRKSTYFSTGSTSISSTYHSMEDIYKPETNEEYPSNDRRDIVYGPATTLPALTAKVPDDWVELKGEFVMVYAAYQTHLSHNCIFVPQAELADGIIWLLIIRAGISRSNLLQFLLGVSTGAHLLCPGVELIPVKGFRIEPEEGTTGLMTVDGEKVDYGTIQAEVFSSLANVMCP